MLEEGFAARARRTSTSIYVNGYGFPAWRGGPMFYADRVGLRQIYDRIDAFHRRARQPVDARAAARAPCGDRRTFRALDRRGTRVRPVRFRRRTPLIDHRDATAAVLARSPHPLGPVSRRRSPSGWSIGRRTRPTHVPRPAGRGWRVAAPHLRRRARPACGASRRRCSTAGCRPTRPLADPVRQQHRARAPGARGDVRRRALCADRAGVLAARARYGTLRAIVELAAARARLRRRRRGVRARARAASPAGRSESSTSTSTPTRTAERRRSPSWRRRRRRRASTRRTRAVGPDTVAKCSSRRDPPAARRA